MTEPKPAIAPRIVDGEPVCSGEECSAFFWSSETDGTCRGLVYPYLSVVPTKICVPAIRRQRDALAAEVERLTQRTSFAANNVALDKIESLERERDAAIADRDCEAAKRQGQDDAIAELRAELDAVQAEADRLRCEAVHPFDASEFKALAAERDAARRELCDELAMWSNEFPVSDDPEWYANERQWSYLYAPAPPATGEEEEP